ncbi:MAG: S-layer y domain [Chthonomonadales bacterium]|nr:S-layer y domain [Chthonomonadales bacterium]
MGAQYQVCPRLNLSADYEGVFWSLSPDSSAIGMQAHPFQSYITLGADFKLAEKTEFKLGYQIGGYPLGGGFGGYGPGGNSSNFNTFTTQLAVRF